MFIKSTVVAHKAMEIDNTDERTWPELLVVLHEIVLTVYGERKITLPSLIAIESTSVDWLNEIGFFPLGSEEEESVHNPQEIHFSTLKMD